MTPSEREDAVRALAHAFDLEPAAFAEPKRLLAALGALCPVETAGSIGDAVRALAAATTTRSIRKALAELTALVIRAAHARTKRAERANLVAQLVLVCGLGGVLGIQPTDDTRTARRRIDALLEGG